MRVRPARGDDAAELGRALKVVVEEDWLALEPPMTAAELAAGLRTRLDEGQKLLALEDDDGASAGEGPLVGLINLRPTRIDGVWSIGLWILPGHRGKGAGRLLVDAAIEARPPGVHKIELEVWPENEAAIRLYERAGFQREGLRRDHYRRRDGRLRSSVIMARLFPDGTPPPPDK
ncbi:MAG: GNAT family N-acetyltransferase [Actinobacteria bacterium]|nr:GNAT family N-acetyltransferase [Actinomycetota bacterium]